MYLHSVNWLHKGLRSDNILFFNVMSQSDRESINLDYGSPTLSGFDYARPDLPEATSEPFTHNIEHDLYRHPRMLGHASSRSRKSDDIYSLGVMLVEIAYWQQIEDIMQLSLRERGNRQEYAKSGKDYWITRRAIMQLSKALLAISMPKLCGNA